MVTKELDKPARASWKTIRSIMEAKGQSRQFVLRQMRDIKEQLDDEGIESFVPDAETALIMAIKGYHTAKYVYDGEGKMVKMTSEYVEPNYQAAILFLKQFAPEKYGEMDGNVYNTVNVAMCEADIKRLTGLAGSLIERKAVDSQIIDNGMSKPESP